MNAKETISKIKHELAKDPITIQEIINCQNIIANYESYRESLPNPKLIYEKARKTDCSTKFIEWFFEKVLKLL